MGRFHLLEEPGPPARGRRGCALPGDTPPHSGGRDAEADFHGTTRTNATHASTTDPEPKLYRKSAGTEARLAFLGHATQANGHTERLAALAMIYKRADRPRVITLGADKGYDTSDFVNERRSMNVRPQVARRLRGSAIDRRTMPVMARASASASASRRRSAG